MSGISPAAAQFPRWGAGFPRRGHRGKFFPPQLRGAGFFPNFRVFPSLSKKLWIAGSLHREGRRSTGSGIFFASEAAGCPPAVKSGFAGFGNSPLPGSGIPPPGSPGSGIFDRFPPPRLREAGFSPAGVKCRGLRVTPFYIVPHGWQGF